MDTRAGFDEALFEVSNVGLAIYVVDHVRKTVTSRFANATERTKILSWLRRHHQGPEEVEVIRWLAILVLGQWDGQRLRTRAQHRALYERISSLSRELSDAMNETLSWPHSQIGSGLTSINVLDLLSDQEAANAKTFLIAKDKEVRKLDLYPLYPSVGLILRRISDRAKKLAKESPLHPQPNRSGAKVGYFVRTMAVLIKQRYGVCTSPLLAVVANIAVNPLDPISATDVGKLIRRTQ